jgi:Ca2+-binding RTX toxin-like protein
MSGGSGADTFVIATGDGNDTVTDWSDGDRLDLSGLADVFAFADLAITGNKVAAGDVTLTLYGLSATNLTADDVLFGERDAAMVLTGSSANETFRGGSGDDSLDAGAGNDIVSGYYGSDILRGNAGNDKVYGGLGIDSVYGGSGNDTVHGGSGDDLVRGGNNSDQLFGGDGDDAVDGEAGDDVLTGGTGADRFAFDDGDGSDVIADYAEEDMIDLTGISTVHGMADLVLGATGFTAGDVSVDIGATGMATLDASDFLFA